MAHPPDCPGQSEGTYEKRRNGRLENHVGSKEIDPDRDRIEYQYDIEKRHLLGKRLKLRAQQVSVIGVQLEKTGKR
ncbi:MAG: hypothetical protein ACOY4N_03390 [Pseudomonadota bacterium]|uniref:hypothetical protein n=1 Tax=Sphingobium TaxID=165695 RepID=UPI001E64D98F|nr:MULTISPECIES: hypothetical protein [Sphingobium]